MLIKPVSILSAWMSPHLLKVETAARKTVFYVKYFKDILFIGSKGLFDCMSSTLGKSYSGTDGLTGGLELKAPFNNLIISGC